MKVGVGVRGDNDKSEIENSKVAVVGTAPSIFEAKRLEPKMHMGRSN